MYGSNIDLFLETFEIFGGFLDDIPIEDRESFIEKELFAWMYNYYCVNPIKDGQNHVSKSYYPKIDASKKIKQIIKTLQDFENLIEEQFGEFFDEMEEYGDSGNIKGEYYDKLRQTKNALNTAKLLQEDISNRDFKWFRHNRFYRSSITSKQELKGILNTTKQRYNIRATDLSIKELIDNIPPFENTIPEHTLT